MSMIARIDDTIAGIATTIGEGGIAIIRISGDDAITVAGRVFRTGHYQNLTMTPDRTLISGWIELDGRAIDEALLVVMRQPHSYTAEDVVEIHCHGGIYLTRTILEQVLRSGARIARPGEFTQRAFLNGRIDLTQAEAVNDIIKAKSRPELEVVVNQLKGKLFERIKTIRESLVWTLSLINAGIDNPDEDIVFTHTADIRRRLTESTAELKQLVASADRGIKLKEGYRIVLMGRPNVGKSSLLNALLRQERAIVHQIPGTTRDTIEEACTIQGIPVSLVDTAGLRHTSDLLEKAGVERTIEAVRQADILLWVIDLTDPSFETDLIDPLRLDSTRVLVVLNKKDRYGNRPFDLPETCSGFDSVTVSAHAVADIERLREAIHTIISGQSGALTEMTLLTNLRQKKAAETALAILQNGLFNFNQGSGEEYLAVDLSQALSALGEIVGETTPDEMLAQIFSRFCIGK
jgi:tRNA modification GTPase